MNQPVEPGKVTSEQDRVLVDGVECLPLVTSHSIDNTFEFCQRRFEFAHVYQQVPESGSVGLAAEAGTALHEAVQAWATVFLAPGVERTAEKQAEAEDAGLLALIRWWPWVQETFAARDKKLSAKQRSLGNSMHLYYNLVRAGFWHEYELAILPDGTVAIEIPWRIIHKSIGTMVDLTGRPRVLVTQGKIDFVLRHRASGKLVVYDLKTTNKKDNLVDAAFRFSGQALQYTFIVAAAVGYDWRKEGMNVTYVVADFNTFAIRPRTYYLSPAEIEDFIRTKDDRLNAMKRNLERKWSPRRTNGCDSYMEACPYMGICASRNSRFIDAWFTAETSPFIERPRIYEALWTFVS